MNRLYGVSCAGECPLSDVLAKARPHQMPLKVITQFHKKTEIYRRRQHRRNAPALGSSELQCHRHLLAPWQIPKARFSAA